MVCSYFGLTFARLIWNHCLQIKFNQFYKTDCNQGIFTEFLLKGFFTPNDKLQFGSANFLSETFYLTLAYALICNVQYPNIDFHKEKGECLFV